MGENRLLTVVQKVLRGAAEFGIEEAGTRVCGSAWPFVKKVLTPLFQELEARYPALLLADKDKAGEAAKKAEADLVENAALRGMLDAALAELQAGQAEILSVLARNDSRLQEIGTSIDSAVRQSQEQHEDIKQTLVAEFRELKLALESQRGAGAGPATNMSVEQIYREANAYQHDAMKWISARDSERASQRLRQGRDLSLAGLQQAPNNADLLATLGYIEKSQAQVSQVLGDENGAVTLLGKAATYFAKAIENDASNISAVNGMANVYLFARDYDRAIRLGLIAFQADPSYGAAAWDLTMALEGKIKEGNAVPEHVGLLVLVYRHLEELMPQQPQVFPANYLSYVQGRLKELPPMEALQASRA